MLISRLSMIALLKLIIASSSPFLLKNNKNDKFFEQPALMPLETKNRGTEIKKEGKWHNPIRLEEIDGYFKVFQSTVISVDVVKIIEEYDHDQPLNELYKSIINKLSMSDEQEKKLDFYNENFASSLFPMISHIQNEIPHHDPVWYDLTRDLFKWMIHMRRFFADNDEKFKEISSNLENNVSKSKFSSLNIPYGLDLDRATVLEANRFKCLVKIEIADHDYLFHFLDSAIKDFYRDFNNSDNNNLNDNGSNNGNEKIPCKNLRLKYFDGNFNNELLLKFMIFMYDPQGEMIKCFLDIEDSAESVNNKFIKKEIPRDFLDNLIKESSDENLEISNLHFTSRFTIEFFLKINRKFKLLNSYNLIILLKKLNEANLLMSKVVSSIMSFEFTNKRGDFFYEWDKDKFIEYLDNERENISKDDYEKYFQIFNNNNI